MANGIVTFGMGNWSIRAGISSTLAIDTRARWINARHRIRPEGLYQCRISWPPWPCLARTQDPHYVDELCYLFPELKVVQIHGGTGNPYMEVAVHNVIKYPHCYLLTDTYRPKYFPPEFIQHLNTRAQDKILWGTAYPIVTFKRSLDDVEQLPLRDHVRPKYLGENALNLFNFG